MGMEVWERRAQSLHIWAFTPRSPETDCAVPQGKVTWQLRSRLRERGLDLGAVGVNLPQMGADEAVGVHGTYCGCDEIPDKSNLRKDFQLMGREESLSFEGIATNRIPVLQHMLPCPRTLGWHKLGPVGYYKEKIERNMKRGKVWERGSSRRE